MKATVIISAIALVAGSALSAQNLPKFMGRDVTVAEAELDEDGFFPKGPATVCVEGPPQRQCYTARSDFGRIPSVTLVEVEKGMPALLFSAASGGVSGFAVHFALLRAGTGKALENLFLRIEVSNQNQHAFWQEPALSPSQIFVTADFAWGLDEGHYGEHRYIISAYLRQPSSLHDAKFYYLEDQYMTARKYDLDKDDILASEKPEILARLKKAKSAAERR